MPCAYCVTEWRPGREKTTSPAAGEDLALTDFYIMMAATQPAAGLVRDLAGDPAAPIVFAAATVLGLEVFRRIEARIGGRLPAG